MIQKHLAPKANDTIFKVETTYMFPQDVTRFLATRHVNVGQVAKVEIDVASGKVGIGVVVPRGIDAQTKTSLTVAYRNQDFIFSLIRVEDLILFEGTKGVAAFRDLTTLTKQLMTIVGAKGEPVVDLYTGTPQTLTRPEQLVQFRDGDTVILNPVGTRGVGNVRFVPWTKDFIGLMLDEHGESKGIVTLPFGSVEIDPTILADPNAWKTITDGPEGRQIASFGRPKIGKDGRVKLVVNFRGGFERILTITKGPDGRDITMWGDEVKTDRTAIGVVNGFDDLFASFIPEETTVELRFEPFRTADMTTQTYLM